jgi:YidC/Oxa1 family membrane protein insertase
MWASFVELIRVAIFAAAHVCNGSLGAGIIGVSVIVRIALLPLTLRLARQARAQQMRVAALKPALDALQRRHASDPARLMKETRALYAANDVRLLSPDTLVGFLVQLPLLSGLFAAARGGLGARVRFIWISNLSQPDALLVGVVTMLAGAVMAMPQSPDTAGGPSTLVLALLGAGGTLLFLWSASSAVALSVGAGSLVSGFQAWLLSRDRTDHARSA